MIDVNVVWLPKTKAEIKFLASTEYALEYNGKNVRDLLLVDPLRYCNNANFRGHFIVGGTQSNNNLKSYVERARDLYSKIIPGMGHDGERSFCFPSGAELDFRDADAFGNRYELCSYIWYGFSDMGEPMTDGHIECWKKKFKNGKCVRAVNEV